MGWRRGQAYGQDLRDRVLAADGPVREVARRFAVSESYVAQARSRQQLGQLSAGVQCNHVPLRLQGLEGAFRRNLGEHEHESGPGTFAARAALPGAGAPGSLEDDPLRLCAA